MSHSSIWVLIAGEQDAAIWTSENGASHLLRVIKQDGFVGEDGKRMAFAWQLMSELLRGAQNGACDGIIIIAEDETLEALHRLMIPEIKRLVIAEIPGAAATISAIPTEPVSMVAWGTLQ